MKRTVACVVLLFWTMATFSQAKEIPDLLQTDSTWGREHFSIPLDFAPQIRYQGREEAVFPPDWAKRDSSAFWSYAFAWDIDRTTPFTEAELEADLRLYFDGLMQSVAGETDLPKTQAVLHRKEPAGEVVTYAGTVMIYDAFFTKALLQLNGVVEQYVCDETKRSVVLFLFSPKEMEDAIWEELEKIRLGAHSCEN